MLKSAPTFGSLASNNQPTFGSFGQNAANDNQTGFGALAAQTQNQGSLFSSFSCKFESEFFKKFFKYF